jgi:hypothetical protein
MKRVSGPCKCQGRTNNDVLHEEVWGETFTLNANEESVDKPYVSTSSVASVA